MKKKILRDTNGEEIDRRPLDLMNKIERKFKKDSKQTGNIKCNSCKKGMVFYTICNRDGLLGKSTAITGQCDSCGTNFAGE